MIKNWIIDNKSKSCVLFFNGWGMDENAVQHLTSSDLDVCMLNNYSFLTNIKESISKYESVYIVAWSLGVWVAAKVLIQSKVNIKKSIAINGTLEPINAEYGIPPNLIGATLTHWTEETRDKFNLRMFGGRESFSLKQNRISARSSDEQKDELFYLKQSIETNQRMAFEYDVALIGSSDMVFLPENQVNYWVNNSRMVEMELPHYPFGAFETWNQIIEL